MKKLQKHVVKYGVYGTRKFLAKYPRVKNAVKRIAHTQLGIPTISDQIYAKWVQNSFPDFIEIAKLRQQLPKLKLQPLISIVVPTYNTNIVFLRDCIDSVLGQVYENWELCIVDDCSTDNRVRKVIEEYAKNDRRVNAKFLSSNKHIAGATNEAIKLASGEFIGLLDHDDLLWPNALFEVVKAINKYPKADFIYTDEDKITEDRYQHLGPFFKPDWNPDFLLSVNYITHFSVVRKTLINKIGGLRAEYNGAQDWDLFFRITSATPNIYHIPKILYSWRIHDLSTAKTTQAKPYVVEAQRRAISSGLKGRGYEDVLIRQDHKNQGYWEVQFELKNKPLVSIVIPSKNQYKIVKRCIDSIYNKSTYENFEIILVDTGSTEKRVLSLYKKLENKHSNFHLIDWPERPFSYSRSCNKGAESANGEVLIMLNNDTEVITPNWIELLAGDALRKEIGAVGCLLFYPDKHHIQHAGVGVGLGGVAANSFSMMTLNQLMNQTQHLMINTKHNMTAVTAACLAIRKQVFNEVGGFDDAFSVTYNDVDLCLRLLERGYINLYTPYVRLLHYESVSLGAPDEIMKRDTKEFKSAQELFKKKWSKYIKHDPNLNPNLDKTNAFYEVKF